MSVADAAEQHDALFVNLVLMFQSAAMQQMGKISNPLTGKVEKNLDQARFSIDMIEMLKAKTRGNVSSEIGALLDSTLTNLRLNYVDEAAKSEKEKTESKSGGVADDTTGTNMETASEAATEGDGEGSTGSDTPPPGAYAERGTEEHDEAEDNRSE
jgi:hypothetical protein